MWTLVINHKDPAHAKVSSEDFEILSVLGTGGEYIWLYILVTVVHSVGMGIAHPWSSWTTHAITVCTSLVCTCTCTCTYVWECEPTPTFCKSTQVMGKCFWCVRSLVATKESSLPWRCWRRPPSWGSERSWSTHSPSEALWRPSGTSPSWWPSTMPSRPMPSST